MSIRVDFMIHSDFKEVNFGFDLAKSNPRLNKAFADILNQHFDIGYPFIGNDRQTRIVQSNHNPNHPFRTFEKVIQHDFATVKRNNSFFALLNVHQKDGTFKKTGTWLFDEGQSIHVFEWVATEDKFEDAFSLTNIPENATFNEMQDTVKFWYERFNTNKMKLSKMHVQKYKHSPFTKIYFYIKFLDTESIVNFALNMKDETKSKECILACHAYKDIKPTDTDMKRMKLVTNLLSFLKPFDIEQDFVKERKLLKQKLAANGCDKLCDTSTVYNTVRPRALETSSFWPASQFLTGVRKPRRQPASF
jgi:sulfur relay (sulfurtransferase) DsrF/TusC family protein